MEIILKDGRKITIERTESKNLEGAKGAYVAYDEKKNDIGILRYHYDQKFVNLDFLTVSDKQFIGCGVGHEMLCEFEKDMTETNARRIVGVFSPMGTGANRARAFYERHGYQFSRDRKNGDVLVVKNVGRGLKPAKHKINSQNIIR